MSWSSAAINESYRSDMNKMNYIKAHSRGMVSRASAPAVEMERNAAIFKAVNSSPASEAAIRSHIMKSIAARKAGN